MKVGLGYDIHIFEKNKPLMLGGVHIPDHDGLKGHSDGDCLLHAIIDAILGAAGLGDIGEYFPDTDPNIKGIDSSLILKKILTLVNDRGNSIGNVDVNIITQKPKLSPYKILIKNRVAELLGISPSLVNIKAKTKEELDAVGQGKAIECQAIVLLV
ncbi:MAG: 2-C-methyl-D-erythritol 2,4-cyclodiphosphate synthase [Planctomycetota bacterium]|nr:MAG: 2-C-methyl-D-erythritol 2,4-cyclodiphosphate synthase [Planctomycetota bacterium]